MRRKTTGAVAVKRDRSTAPTCSCETRAAGQCAWRPPPSLGTWILRRHERACDPQAVSLSAHTYLCAHSYMRDWPSARLPALEPSRPWSPPNGTHNQGASNTHLETDGPPSTRRPPRSDGQGRSSTERWGGGKATGVAPPVGQRSPERSESDRAGRTHQTPTAPEGKSMRPGSSPALPEDLSTAGCQISHRRCQCLR